MSDWIDTHCHLDAPEFAHDGAAMRRVAAAGGVRLCVVPAVAASNFDAVRHWAHDHGDAYALGIHPLCSGDATDADLARLESELVARAGDPRLVAVGEIGLDYFVRGLDDVRQQHVFRAQLRLARRFDLPVLLHVRRSVDRVLRHLREQGGSGAARHAWRGIAHAFNGSPQQAQAFVDLGFKLGFGGTATFDRALQVRRVATAVPLSAMVVETDAPDIPPHWLYRTAGEREKGSEGGGGQARNSPVELPRIGAAIAALRGLPAEDFAAATTRNALEAMPRLAGLLA